MGLLYLIQPVELCGTNRYKIGCSSKNTLERVLSYKKGSRYLITITTELYNEIEKILIKEFNNKFTCIAGKEYFEGNESDMFNLFLDIIKKHNKIPQQELIEHNNEENVEQTTDLQDTTKLKQPKIHRCYFCNYQTNKKSSFINHIIMKKNKCSFLLKGDNIVINKLEDYYKLVELHIKEPNNSIWGIKPVKQPKIHQCYFCNYSTQQKTHFKDHIMKKNKCSYLLRADNIKINNLDDYYKLVELHKKEPNNSIWGVEPEIPITAESDIILQTPENTNHICNHCNKSFARKDSLRRHLNGRCKVLNKQKKQNKENFQNLDIINNTVKELLSNWVILNNTENS